MAFLAFLGAIFMMCQTIKGIETKENKKTREMADEVFVKSFSQFRLIV